MNNRLSSKLFQPRPALLRVCLLLVSGSTASHCLADAVSDIVVGYSSGQAARSGGESALQSGIYNQIASANAVAFNSGSPHRQRVVGLIQSAENCDGLTTTGGMVGWLANNNSHVADVRAYADALGADLVSYIFQNGDSVAGVAEQPGRYSAYNNQLWWTYFAHESGGHNFGGNHGDGYVNPTTVMANNYCGGGAQGFYTNPNIWQNGVRLLSTGNCTGGTAYGGDSAYYISTTAQGRADSWERLVYGSYRDVIVYRWQFTNSPGPVPAGTVIADEVSSAQAVVRGAGAAFTGTALRLPGGTTGNVAADSIAAYVDLPNGIFSALPNFTIEIWAAPQSAQSWMHILDIGRTTEAGDGLGAAGEYTGTPGSVAPGVTSGYDEIGLTAVNASASLNNQRLIAALGGVSQIADSTLTTTAGDLHCYTLTFTDTTSGGVLKWFRDGALVNTLNVAFHSASLSDVNNWLGRSMYSGDSMANVDYYDVRIQNTALTDGQVAANYLIGPNDRVVTLRANDVWGSSGFISGAWEFGQSTPDASHDYDSGSLRLLTPWTTTDSTFPGRSVTITGGNLYLAGKDANTITINDLRLNGGTIHSFGDNGSTETLAGQITVLPSTQNQIRGEWGPMIVSAKISGQGSMQYTEKAVTLTGNNTNYTGQTVIGDGRFSTLNISSEANLGGNPPSFGGDWLMLNRGILVTTATMTLDDSNRGIRIGPSGGFFRPNAGTTLTIATPISSPAAGNTLQTAPLDSNPVMGILFVDGQGVVEFTNPNNSHNAEMQINAGELRLSGNGRINNGNHWMPITINGKFTDNSALDQTLSGVITGNGSLFKGNLSTLTLSGANTFSGPMTVSGGKLLVNGNSSGTGVITVANGGTLGGTGSVGGSVSVQSGGTLSPGSGVGTFTVNANVILQAGSTNLVEISKAPLSSDVLNVTGTLNLGGTLKISNLSGTLAYGDSFTIFHAGTVAGGFAAYSLPPLAAGLKWDTNAILSGIISVGSTNDAPPVIPAGLAASWISSNQVRLIWSPAYAATSYNIKRSTAPGGPYTTIATGVTNASFNNGNLATGTTYYYVVSAVNAFGESGNSAPVLATAVVTKAYWNFQEGTADTFVPYAPASAGQFDGSMHDVSGSGNPLSAWSGSWHWYRAQVPAATTPQTGTPNSLSVQNANNYPAISAIGTSLTSWNPKQWTIEAAIRPDSVAGYQTVVGRDSQGAYAGNTALSALYFSVRPNGILAIEFTDSAGNNWNLESAAGAVSSAKWQATAASSDGKMLSLYLKNVTDGAASYTLLGTLDISGSVNPALSTGAGNGTDWDPGVITVARGLYNGGHTDRFYGYIDDVRLTAGTLNPAAFLYSAPPAFPAAPTGLTANGVTNNQINLTWSASGGATGYYLKRSAANGGPYTIVANPMGTSFNDTGLTNGTMYYYVVSAVNSAGEGTNSVQVSARAISTVPTNIAFAASGDAGQLTLSWPADHTGWRLQAQTNSLATGLDTNWFDVPGSTTTNRLIVPVDPSNGSTFFRLIFP